MEEDSEDCGGESNPGEDEEGECVVGENVSANGGVRGEENG